MDEAGFKAWLLGDGRERAVKPTGAAHRVDRLRKIEENLSGLGLNFANLDAAYDADRLASTIEAIKTLQLDHKTNGQAYRILMPQSEKPGNRLANLRTFLGQYREYRDGVVGGNKDADRIRQHALEDYIIPAREEGKSLVTIAIRTVNDALGLNQGWPNIQQSLTGPKFLEMAEVEAPMRKGPRQSTTTTFTYYLDDGALTGDVVRDALRIQFGAPLKDTVKMFAVEAPDGRQLALSNEGTGVPLVWLEAEGDLPSDAAIKSTYSPDQPRDHGLPSRLAHKGDAARRVALCRVETWPAFISLIEHHTDQSPAVAPDTSQSVEGAEAVPPVPGPTNLILYGPPGTGKTFATAREAVKLCSPGVDLDNRAAVDAEYGRLVEARQVELVTFHQSYSYEDFVEGLRPPVSSKDGEGDEDKSGFRLEISPGVFHRIATRATASKGSTGKSFDLAGRQVFKMSIGEAANPEDAYLFEESLENGYALLGFGQIDWSDERFAKRDAMIEAWKKEEPESEPPTPRSASVQCPDMFRNWIKPGDIVIVSKGNGSFRAIGEVTGPYEYAPRDDGGYFHRRAINWLWSDRAGVPVEEIYAKRFSMRTLYMLTTSDLNMSALQRYITSQEPGGPPEPFVLIIDEINRANISKVFGELITLLEPDKRLTPDGGGLKVRLPYSKEAFGVPANLHVIGTMNTADRSIALLDTALRRRFEFRELMPDPDLPELKAAGARCGVNLGKLLRTLNDRIEYLFDREHQIGHAYFIKCASRSDLDAVMRHKVIPLLAEYFYEDWSKVALVLGDADASKPGRFLDRTELKPPAGSDFEGGDTRWRWTVRSAFSTDAYADFQ
jgi:5-methylcytosine-specific restriction protein B